MTLLYTVNDVANVTVRYIVPDNDTESFLTSNDANLSVIIGSIDDATRLLDSYHSEYIQSYEFNIHKSILNDDGSHTWINIDLNDETDNDDTLYSILNSPNGNFIECIGLSNIKMTLDQIQKNVINWQWNHHGVTVLDTDDISFIDGRIQITK